jgi:DNA-binding PadR family transcriptional regulator
MPLPYPQSQTAITGPMAGTVYPALHRLEAASLLTSSWDEAARRRRVYRLTRSGRRELGARRREWREFTATIEAVMA